jgi:hypothetical protein
VSNEVVTLLPVAAAAPALNRPSGRAGDAMSELKAASWAASGAPHSVRARRSALRSRSSIPPPPAAEEQPDGETRVSVRSSAWNPF